MEIYVSNKYAELIGVLQFLYKSERY